MKEDTINMLAKQMSKRHPLGPRFTHARPVSEDVLAAVADRHPDGGAAALLDMLEQKENWGKKPWAGLLHGGRLVFLAVA